MKLNVVAFTRKAAARTRNQDRVLVGDRVIEDGDVAESGVTRLRAFVADGIGGMRGGELAARFVLEAIRERLPADADAPAIQRTLAGINADLIAAAGREPDSTGAGTTLVGLLVSDAGFQLVSAGDSEAWAVRDKRMFAINEPQVLDGPGSPLTSYFGGAESELDLSFYSALHEIRVGDVYLLCSDGLAKAVPRVRVRAVLCNNRTLQEKAEFLRRLVVQSAEPDDTSCVLIEVVE